MRNHASLQLQTLLRQLPQQSVHAERGPVGESGRHPPISQELRLPGDMPLLPTSHQSGSPRSSQVPQHRAGSGQLDRASRGGCSPSPFAHHQSRPQRRSGSIERKSNCVKCFESGMHQGREIRKQAISGDDGTTAPLRSQRPLQSSPDVFSARRVTLPQ